MVFGVPSTQNPLRFLQSTHLLPPHLPISPSLLLLRRRSGTSILLTHTQNMFNTHTRARLSIYIFLLVHTQAMYVLITCVLIYCVDADAKFYRRTKFTSLQFGLSSHSSISLLDKLHVRFASGLIPSSTVLISYLVVIYASTTCSDVESVILEIGI